MKRILPFLLPCFILVLFSCNNKKESSLNESALATEVVTIQVDKDTTFKTKNGALIQIPKGALSVTEGTSARLEIKEAYSIEQIVKAGLFTRTGEEPLSSGGMIYINAAAGQAVTIKKNIRIAIPTHYLQEGMQLYKGNKTTGGTINWENPRPLNESQQLAVMKKGKTLFEKNCASCHGIGKEGSGPDLAHFPKRFNYGDEGNWRYFYHTFLIASEYKEFFHPDLYGCNLINKYGEASPPFFSNITDTGNSADLMSIYSYIQQESDRRNLPLPPHHYLISCVDSCNAYTAAVRELEAKRKSLIKKNAPRTTEINNPPVSIPPPDTTPPPVNYGREVSPGNFQAVYYEFTIESFGWFNIDILLKDVPGIEKSSLLVRIRGSYRETITIYLILPQTKVYLPGGLTNNPDEYAFYKKDGSVPLPQNEKAYILALTETGDSIAYALQEFTTARSQQIEIELSKSTKEALSNAIEKLRITGLEITAQDSRNSAAIKKVDQEIKDAEKLKPKRCDCNCGAPQNIPAREGWSPANKP